MTWDGRERREQDPYLSTLKRIERDVADIRVTLHGDNGSPGLRIRVDRLEQRAKFTSWLAGTAFGSVLTAAGVWLWHKTTGGP